MIKIFKIVKIFKTIGIVIYYPNNPKNLKHLNNPIKNGDV